MTRYRVLVSFAGTQGIQVDGLNGLIKLIGVPTRDPHVVGAIWNDSGTLKISAG